MATEVNIYELNNCKDDTERIATATLGFNSRREGSSYRITSPKFKKILVGNSKDSRRVRRRCLHQRNANSVWVLVNARRLGISEAELLEDYPTRRAADLVNAFSYAEAFPDEIETAIREQEEA